jgi:hypothetical protein
MAKRLKDILEAVGKLPHHGRDKAEGEKDFKKLHTAIINDPEHPTGKKNTDILNAKSMKKDTSKITHLSKEEEEAANESVEQDDVNTVLESILSEEDLLENFQESVLDDIQAIVEADEERSVELTDGTTIDVDPDTARNIVNVMEFLSDENSEKFLEKLETSEEDFLKMVDFAISMGDETE